MERAHYRLLQIQIPCSKIIIIQADRSESEMLMLLLPLLLLPSVRQNFIGHLIRGGGGGGDECAVVIKKAISFIWWDETFKWRNETKLVSQLGPGERGTSLKKKEEAMAGEEKVTEEEKTWNIV